MPWAKRVAELIVPERFRAAHAAAVDRFLANGTGPLIGRKVELEALRSDGTEFPVELTLSAVRDGDRWKFHAFVADISGRRETEQQRDLLVDELRVALQDSERRFQAVVGSFSDPVTIRDRQDRIVYANRAALQTLGFDSVQQLRLTPPADIMADYIVSGDDGRPVAMEDIPSVRILRGQPAEPLLIRTIHRQTGAQRWQLLKSAPLLDSDREIEATITVIEDVTEQKRAERQNAFLADVSAALASSLDYEQTLRNVAQLAVPDVVDWCAVDLRDEDGDRRPVAVAHADPGQLKLAEELRNYEEIRLNPNEGIGLVFRTGQPVLYPAILDEMLVRLAADQRHLDLLREVGMRSVAVVPMSVGNRILGAMTLVNAESGRMLDDFDLRLAQQVADRAAVAIEERPPLQRALVDRPHAAAEPAARAASGDSGFELASVYIPAFESTEVGGDFYDVWELEDGWMLMIGDVTGKGIEAAALTSLVRHTMRARLSSSPARPSCGPGRQHSQEAARPLDLHRAVSAVRGSGAAGRRWARRCRCMSLARPSTGSASTGRAARRLFGRQLGGQHRRARSPTVSWSRTPTASRTRSVPTGPARAAAVVRYPRAVPGTLGDRGDRRSSTVALGEFQIGAHADGHGRSGATRRGPWTPERERHEASEAEDLA